MHTKQQFTEQCRAYRLQFTVAAVGLSVVWGFVCVAVHILFRPWFRTHSTAEEFVVAFSLVLLAVSYGIVAKVLHKRHGLVCPSCGDWIGSQHLMLTTGRCPRCKTAMFHES